MHKLLLTGFDPFAHYQKNPSWEVAQALPEVVGDFAITKLLLPNIYGLAGRMLLEKAAAMQPDVILMLGMDSGSAHVHLDTVAVNLRDALVEDNLGNRPWNEPIIADGPAAYFSTLPVHQAVRELQAEKNSRASWLHHRRLCLQRYFLYGVPSFCANQGEGWLCPCAVAAGNGVGRKFGSVLSSFDGAGAGDYRQAVENFISPLKNALRRMLQSV